MKTMVILGVLVLLSGCQSPAPQGEQTDVIGEETALTSVSELSLPSNDTDHEAATAEESVSHGSVPVDAEVTSADLEEASFDLVVSYLALTDEIGARAGADAGAMAELVTAQWYPTEERAFRGYIDSNIKTIGTTVFDHFEVQSSRRTASGLLEVAVFLCVDSRNVWVVDASTPEPPEDLVVWLGAGAHRIEPTDEQYQVWQEYLDLAEPVAGFREPVVMWLLGESRGTLHIDATENWIGIDPCGDAE